MELLYASGIRRAELVGLNLSDVDLEKRVMRVIGKGNKQRMVFINQAAADAIRLYLGVRPRTVDEALFISRRKSRLSHRQAWVIFRTFAQLSGLTKHVTPHVMRHSFATHLLENGADFVTFYLFLFLFFLSSTQLYPNFSLHHILKIYQSPHPLHLS